MYEALTKAQQVLTGRIDVVRQEVHRVASDTRLTDQARREEAGKVWNRHLPALLAAREAETAARGAGADEVAAKVAAGYARSRPTRVRNPNFDSTQNDVRAAILHELQVGNARARLHGATPAELGAALQGAVESGDRATESVVRDLTIAHVRTVGADWKEPGGVVAPGDWPSVDWQDRHVGQHAGQLPDVALVRLVNSLAALEHSRFNADEAEALSAQRTGQAPGALPMGELFRVAISVFGSDIAARQAVPAELQPPVHPDR